MKEILQYLMKKREKTIWLLYSCALLVPIIIYAGVYFGVQALGYSPYLGSNEPVKFGVTGVAAVLFLFYLRHTTSFSLKSTLAQVAFSFAYGWSSFVLLQQSGALPLLCYSIFPILFLAFEFVLLDKKYILYLFLLALTIGISPEIGLPVAGLLFVLGLITMIGEKTLDFGRFMHFLLVHIAGIALAAFRVLFTIPIYYAYHELYAYEGFSWIVSPGVFVSRFFTGANPSVQYVNVTNRMDVYFGMILLCFSLLYFFQSKRTSGERVVKGIFSLFLGLALIASPMNYLLNGFLNLKSAYNPFAYFIVFWGLYLAAQTVSELMTTKVLDVIKAMTLIVGGVCFSWYYSSHNFPLWMFGIHVACLILFATFVIAFLKKHKKQWMMCLFVCVFAEMIFNMVWGASMDWRIGGTSVVASDLQATIKARGIEAKEQKKQKTESDVEESDGGEDADQEGANQEDQEKQSAKLDADEINLFMENLQKEVPYEKQAVAKYCGKEMPDVFDTCNYLAKKLGVSKKIFKEKKIDVKMESTNIHKVTDFGNNIFAIESMYGGMLKDDTIPLKINDDVSNLYFYSNFTSRLSDAQDLRDSGQFIMQSSGQQLLASFMMYCQFVQVDEKAITQCDTLLSEYSAQKKEEINEQLRIYDYVGVGSSVLVLFILMYLLGYDEREKVYKSMRSFRDKLNEKKGIKAIRRFLVNNRVYILAFLLPFAIFMGMLVYRDCEPFGPKNTTMFEDDGSVLTAAGYYEQYYNQEAGNQFFSMNSGFGTNAFIHNPIAFLTKWLHFLPVEYLLAAVMLLFCLQIGATGLTMAWYMTHRRVRPARADDYRILIPGTIYALSAHMIRFRAFPAWGTVMLLLPIIMWLFERLIYTKKWFAYTLILSVAILLNISIGWYTCIFLGLNFLLCDFQGVADFVKKGLRFAFASLLAAGNAFVVIYSTLLASKDLEYKSLDRIAPKIKLHTNFLEEWQNYMIFSPTKIVTPDDGAVYAYFGIISMFLVLCYFMQKKYAGKERIGKLLLLLFITISFNENVLSYLWNGFHYQTKVPSRFAYLLVFVVAELAYDGLKGIHRIRRQQFAVITISIAGAMILIQGFRGGNSNIAFCATALIIIMTSALIFLLKRQKRLHTILVSLLLIELCVNGFYDSSKWNNKSMNAICSEKEDLHKTLCGILDSKKEFSRFAFNAAQSNNIGQVLGVPCGDEFNSFVTVKQNNMMKGYGFYGGGNNISASQFSTPLGQSMAGIRYLCVNMLGQQVPKNLQNYKFLGVTNGYFIFENTKALSVGVYVSEDIKPLNSEALSDPLLYHNVMSVLYSGSLEEIINKIPLKYSMDLNEENSFCFLDYEGNTMEQSVAHQVLVEHINNPALGDMTLYANINCISEGEIFAYGNQFKSLGHGKKGENKKLVFSVQPEKFDGLEELYMGTFNDKVFEKFYQEIRKNQLRDVQIKNDTISGHTNYPKSGYTMFSIPYDKSFKAFVDGREVEVENLHNSNVFVKTPAGKHTVTLQFIPYGVKTSLMISIGFWCLSLVAFCLCVILRKRAEKKE